MPINIKPVMNDLLQVRIVCFSNGQYAMNVLHWVVTNVTTLGATVNEIASALDDTWHVAYKNWLSDKATYIGTGVRILTPPQTLEQPSTGNSDVGTNTSLQVPTQNAGLIVLKTDFSGPKNRGRIFVPFVSTGSVAPTGELSVGGTTLLNAIATAIDTTQTIVGGTGTTTLALVVKHGPGPTNPPPSLLSVLVKTIAASSGIATQRKRGDFGKLNSYPFPPA